MATVCWLNQLSSARENVVVAATARSSAGSAAIRLNSATMRACSRAPATFSFHARHRPIICQAITATMAMTRRTLIMRAVSTTSLRGTIGVSPVRMK
jgi:hypothetical protein